MWEALIEIGVPPFARARPAAGIATTPLFPGARMPTACGATDVETTSGPADFLLLGTEPKNPTVQDTKTCRCPRTRLRRRWFWFCAITRITSKLSGAALAASGGARSAERTWATCYVSSPSSICFKNPKRSSCRVGPWCCRWFPHIQQEQRHGVLTQIPNSRLLLLAWPFQYVCRFRLSRAIWWRRSARCAFFTFHIPEQVVVPGSHSFERPPGPVPWFAESDWNFHVATET